MKFRGLIAVALGSTLFAESLSVKEANQGVLPDQPHGPEEHQPTLEWIQAIGPVAASGTFASPYGKPH